MPDLNDNIAAAAAGPILACLKETEGEPATRDDQSVAEEVAYDIAAGIVDVLDLDMIEELLGDLIAKSDVFDREALIEMFDRLTDDMLR